MALQELTRRKPILKNRTPPEVEAFIVELSLDRRLMAKSASPTSFASSAIRFRWPGCAGCFAQRHDLETMKKRLKALEAKVAQEGLVLTESQLAARWRRPREKRRRMAQLESECPGYAASRIRSTSAT